MHSRVEIWDALVEAGKQLPGVADVRALPVNRVNDEKFLEVFPDLKMPALLIVYLGSDDTTKGQAMDRIDRWGAVIVAEDPAGDAYKVAAALLDEFTDGKAKMLDKEILGDDVVVHGTHSVDTPFTSARFSVYQVAFETRQTWER